MMKLRDNIFTTNSEGIIFNSESGDNFIVNKVGFSIIAQLQEKKDENEIVSFLTEHYNIDRASAKADLVDFCSLLKLYDLVEDE